MREANDRTKPLKQGPRSNIAARARSEGTGMARRIKRHAENGCHRAQIRYEMGCAGGQPKAASGPQSQAMQRVSACRAGVAEETPNARRRGRQWPIRQWARMRCSVASRLFRSRCGKSCSRNLTPRKKREPLAGQISSGSHHHNGQIVTELPVGWMFLNWKVTR